MPVDDVWLVALPKPINGFDPSIALAAAAFTLITWPVARLASYLSVFVKFVKPFELVSEKPFLEGPDSWLAAKILTMLVVGVSIACATKIQLTAAEVPVT